MLVFLYKIIVIIKKLPFLTIYLLNTVPYTLFKEEYFSSLSNGFCTPVFKITIKTYKSKAGFSKLTLLKIYVDIKIKNLNNEFLIIKVILH